MAADDHHLLGALASGNLADHVAAIGVGFHARRHLQVDLDANAGGAQARDHHGVFGRNRGRRNPGLALVVAQGPGMGNLHGQRRDRAHQRRHRPQRRRPRRTRRAVRNGLAVSAIRLVIEHDLALHPVAAQCGQFLETGDGHHLRRDSSRRRANAHPQPQHVEGLVHGLQHTRRFGPPHPVRHFDRDYPHVAQAGGLHLLRRPGDGALQRRRAAQPGADAVTEVRQTFVSFRIGHRGGGQLVRRGAVLVRQIRTIRAQAQPSRGQENGNRYKAPHG